MLNLLFVEASLELVPKQIAHHPSVTRNAKREGKRPDEFSSTGASTTTLCIVFPKERRGGGPTSFTSASSRLWDRH
jgi:rRNA pseudouridine-1189 N-methylase Emg1 (Nep1/Mra1 family)